MTSDSSKTAEELAEEYAMFGKNDVPDSVLKRQKIAEQKFDFLAGYQAAKEHAHAALEKAEVRMQELRDQLMEESGGRLKLFKDDADAKAAYQEALEEIELDKAYHQGLKDGAPQWISVKEGMPEEDVTVLAFVHYSVDGAKLERIDSAAYRGRLWLMGRDIYSEGFITHWMPLPQPPKEEA